MLKSLCFRLLLLQEVVNHVYMLIHASVHTIEVLTSTATEVCSLTSTVQR